MVNANPFDGIINESLGQAPGWTMWLIEDLRGSSLFNTLPNEANRMNLLLKLGNR